MFESNLKLICLLDGLHILCTETAVKLEFFYDKEHGICTMVINMHHCARSPVTLLYFCQFYNHLQMQAVNSVDHLVPKGEHVLTINGTSTTKAIIAWVITA